ncbi:MAG TPA: SMP-30/gluconolactonase/LRE family protein [Casimicrobiaceae bacterium]|jgi:sugar lactone lactonase YvrE
MTTAPSRSFACVLDAKASLGECPVWSVVEQVLYWVDIKAPALHRFDPATGDDTMFTMPESIGCFALRAQGGFVVALRSGIWTASLNGMLERKIAAAPYDPERFRFNDGRCDPQGRFFAGSMNEKRDSSTAALYRVDRDGTLLQVIGGITISNGLAWSPDGQTMYHADTPTHTIHAYDYDTATGTPSNPKTFARWDGDTDRPDGGAVDSSGNYWSAFYRGGKIVQLSPSGAVIAEYPIPAMCPTMCAFGGADLKTLYVTSARQMRDVDELARLPQSGGVFAMRVDVPGLPEPSCSI